MASSSQDHWNNVYKNKKPEEVSWMQLVPTTSLDFIHSFNLTKAARIIDVGGGDSRLADFLLDEGYKNITVLDISEEAINKAKKRLGKKAEKINWIVSDITAFNPDEHFDVWHDRATFHFLTTSGEVSRYLDTARKSVEGFLTIGTFSDNGPEKCSGLPIKQYNEATLEAQLQQGFDKIRCITEDHTTPFNTKQNFLFCSFKRHVN